jgi:hypothetical protein
LEIEDTHFNDFCNAKRNKHKTFKITLFPWIISRKFQYKMLLKKISTKKETNQIEAREECKLQINNVNNLAFIELNLRNFTEFKLQNNINTNICWVEIRRLQINDESDKSENERIKKWGRQRIRV